ncbi:MAG: hypothetical protein GEV04_23260 [Actinophytocola sp.]|nr:hypothetical protein [Actinophytocola sp.]
MVLWWIGNAFGLLIVIPLVAVLALRVLRQAREIDRYAHDILTHGVLLAGNLDPLPALLDTRDRVGEVTGNAVRYVTALERLV